MQTTGTLVEITNHDLRTKHKKEGMHPFRVSCVKQQQFYLCATDGDQPGR